MLDPMGVLEQLMEDQAEREPTPPITASRLAFEMGDARRMIAKAALDKAVAEHSVADAKEALALVEAMEIDRWLGTIPPDQIKARYGSNEAERERNTRLMLSTSAGAAHARTTLRVAEVDLAVAVAKFLSAQAAIEHWQALAWAYGGECNMAAAPARPMRTRPHADALHADLIAPF